MFPAIIPSHKSRANMANFIPPLDFSASPNSFCHFPVSPAHSVQAAESEIDECDSDLTAGAGPISEGLCYGLGVASIEKPCIRDIPVRHSKLVKRQPSRKAKDYASTAPKSNWRSYRCSIHATTGKDFTAAEAECKDLIFIAGGDIIDKFVFPGGFLYRIPPTTGNPLQDGDETASGGRIEIAPWTPFPKPIFSAFTLQPYHAVDRTVSVSKRTTIAGPEQLLLAAKPLLGASTNAGVFRRRTLGTWFVLLARDYGKNISYIA